MGDRRRYGVRLLTHVGKYQGEIVAANILGEPREAHYEAVPDVVYTDPQAAAVGASEAPFNVNVPVSEVAKTATYTHAYAQSPGFLTLLSDGEQLTGAYALGPEAGEWMQQATLAIRARCQLPCCATSSSPSPPSRRSTWLHSKHCTTRSGRAADRPWRNRRRRRHQPMLGYSVVPTRSTAWTTC